MADNVGIVLGTMNPDLYRYFMDDDVDHVLQKEHIKKLERENIKEKQIERLQKERKHIEEELEKKREHVGKLEEVKKPTRKDEEELENEREHIKKLEKEGKHIKELEKEREHTHVLHCELTPNHNTILHVAVQFGGIKNVEVVLQECPDLVLQQNKKGETPLHMAAREGQANVVEALILGAQRLNCGDGRVVEMLKLATYADKDTALHIAARNCHLKGDYLAVVKLLLKEARREGDTLLYWDLGLQHLPNEVGETPLYLAVERGKEGQEIVLELLKTCNSPNHFSGPGGRTALHAVAFHYKDFEDQSTVQKLLTRIEDLIDTQDKDASVSEICWTPLQYVPDKIGWTPLQYAACSGNVLVMKKLLSINPDCWEMVDKNGRNILHIAVDKNMKSVIDHTIEQDWFPHLINQKDNNGNTPLHLLVNSDYRVDELWKHDKADKHVFNDENMTPVDLVWSTTIKKTGLHTFAKAYIEDETFLGSEIDGGRIIAFLEHDNLAKFKRFKEEEMTKEQNKKKEKDEKDDARKKKQIESRKASMTVYQSLVVVAALIATISSAAGFVIPGGYDSNQGRNQGMAVLARAAAFKAFIITNTIALASSVTSILLCLNALYYYSISEGESDNITQRYAAAGVLILVSIFSLMLAFISATFAVLAHSIALAVSTCIIVCIVFIVFFREDGKIIVKQLLRAEPVPEVTNNGSGAMNMV